MKKASGGAGEGCGGGVPGSQPQPETWPYLLPSQAALSPGDLQVWVLSLGAERVTRADLILSRPRTACLHPESTKYSPLCTTVRQASYQGRPYAFCVAQSWELFPCEGIHLGD